MSSDDMDVVICPGIHDPDLTQQFVTTLQAHMQAAFGSCPKLHVFPAQYEPPYSGLHVLHFLQAGMEAGMGINTTNHVCDRPLLFIAFSAGVVGAAGAAWSWRQLGRPVAALIAIDGWGVPLAGDFPIHRVSHDFFTHWSSALLGAGEDSFYADPSVNHLDIWRSPATATGWAAVTGASPRTIRTTAVSFLTDLIHRYSSKHQG